MRQTVLPPPSFESATAAIYGSGFSFSKEESRPFRQSLGARIAIFRFVTLRGHASNHHFVSLLLTGVAIEGARKGKRFMPEKRPDPSEVVDSIQHLNGRIDAVLYLVSVLVATFLPF